LELAPLKVAQLREWRVADDLLDAAAQLRAPHWWGLERTASFLAPPDADDGGVAAPGRR
jgi:hypothetical protein